MPFKFTLEKFSKCIPTVKNHQEWFNALTKYLPDYEIESVERIGMFLAQCAHESRGFTVLNENLNYRADRLKAVFPKYFRDVDPANYANKPQAIANRVYANRMGNGDEASGDGWLFHGRGLIQLTGRSNYAQCSDDAWGDTTLLTNPDTLCTVEGAVLSACWFWDNRNINEPSDDGDIATVTKLINGGYTNLDDRTERYNKIIPILKAP